MTSGFDKLPALRLKKTSPGPSKPGARLLSPASQRAAAAAAAAPTGPTIFSLLATRRLARQFANRVYARRATGSVNGCLGQVEVEPSYRMEPKRRFDSKEVGAVMKAIIDQRMADFRYSAKRASMLTKILTEEIKEGIKELEFERYKIVCVVTVGEKIQQGLLITSRCAWDTSIDNSSTYNWQSGAAFCCATVYGLYHE